ncbi:hypothetical protein Pflav_032680 [Phytohabitans flavus]|uniref:Uncharacterized protein n=1 Tax=Phytohabitans flavus TaxID=1076124 RepID=A0A6F8XSY9_9ACTN|nr:hypothetical protein Pflav_032680 [Phytohabitans flavus]
MSSTAITQPARVDGTAPDSESAIGDRLVGWVLTVGGCSAAPPRSS